MNLYLTSVNFINLNIYFLQKIYIKNNKNIIDYKENIIIVNDFFMNFMEHINFFKKIIKNIK
jgi:hypothetical protein